jgi:hypothetical protein
VTARFFSWNLRAYRGLLTLYPDGLRRDFGAEMLEAFAYDLSAACVARGMKGAIHVWRITLRETIRIGLPVWLQTPAVAVPVLSAAGALVSQSPLLIVAIRRETQLGFHPGDTTPVDALVALAIGAVITALTSFVAVYRWKRAHLICLDIDQPGIDRLGIG